MTLKRTKEDKKEKLKIRGKERSKGGKRKENNEGQKE